MEHNTDEKIRELIISRMEDERSITESELNAINPDKDVAIDIIRRLAKEISYDIETKLGENGNLYLTS